MLYVYICQERRARCGATVNKLCLYITVVRAPNGERLYMQPIGDKAQARHNKFDSCRRIRYIGLIIPPPSIAIPRMCICFVQSLIKKQSRCMMDIWRLAHVVVMMLQIAQGDCIVMNDPPAEVDRKEESNEAGAGDGDDNQNWNVNVAVKDVAYYLRAHKFSDYDRRYFRHINEATSRLWEQFPKPPLRSLHWEVQSHCDGGFVSCLKYLHSHVLEAPLQRKDDTVVIVRNNKWTFKDNMAQIYAVEHECKTALVRDNETFDPFHGPIGCVFLSCNRYIASAVTYAIYKIFFPERFQWRTTASYYMCWFTMLGRKELYMFDEDCDDFAGCSDETFISNHDPRAVNDNAFACAMYSFCPDPCCPLRHVHMYLTCATSPLNPCANITGIDYHQVCNFKREDNQNFLSLVSNQLNLSCACADPGYEWSSRFGQCVDVNECTRGDPTCDQGAICINSPGSFECVCKFGYVFNEETHLCDPDSKVITFLSRHHLLIPPSSSRGATIMPDDYMASTTTTTAAPHHQ